MRILIVDDNEVALAVLQNALLFMGHKVVVCLDGCEAMEILRQQSFHAIISDWEMPTINGLELCRHVRERPCSTYTYFILLTSRDSSDDIIAGLSAGADDFLIKPFCSAELRARLQGAERLLSLETRNVTIFALAKLAEHRDSDTGAHLERMREYARILAIKLTESTAYRDKIDVEFIHLLHLTAPLHDIGKVGVPDNILLKPGPLTDAERAVMQQHANIGANTLTEAAEQTSEAKYLQMASELARFHHERFDGTGYPQGLAGHAIPLCARIAALADVYDALTSDRVYRAAMTHEEAREIIERGSGSHFEPEIVEAFLRSEDEFLLIRDRFRDEARAPTAGSPSLMSPSPAVEIPLNT